MLVKPLHNGYNLVVSDLPLKSSSFEGMITPRQGDSGELKILGESGL